MTRFEHLDRLSVTVLAEDSVGYESPLWGQHGLSFFVEAERDGISRKVLVDVGQDPQALLHNMRLLEIHPESIDSIVLTHCHYDHTRGLAEVLKAAGKRDLPVVAHPDLFRLDFVETPYLRHVGVPAADSLEAIEAAGGRLFLTSDPLSLLPGLSTTGRVPRQTDFEETGIELRTIDRDCRVVPDLMDDDLALIAALPGGKLVILTGCSHAGIVNIARHSMELTGLKDIRAILGGLHLVEASSDRIRKTVDALGSLPLDSVCAGHCTGFEAQVELRLKIGNRFQPLRTGMRLEYP